MTEGGFTYCRRGGEKSILEKRSMPGKQNKGSAEKKLVSGG